MNSENNTSTSNWKGVFSSSGFLLICPDPHKLCAICNSVGKHGALISPDIGEVATLLQPLGPTTLG